MSSLDDPGRRNNPTQGFAKKRRERPTKTEAELENILNSMDRGLYKGKFQREWVFAGKWILDFFFAENRLGIDLCREHPRTEEQSAKYVKKAKAAAEAEVTLLRLTTSEVFGAREALLTKIREGHEKAARRQRKSPTLVANAVAEKNKGSGGTVELALTAEEKTLIKTHLPFYVALATEERQPTTDAQRHFLAVCEGRASAETEHEVAFVKYMRLYRRNVRGG